MPAMNEHQALYRKYRPHDWGQVVGQDHIVSVLQGQLTKGQTAHAYLFSGTRGLGKTTVARIFARELGCQPEDIYEIDGASNRKIEHARELREAVRTMPMSSEYKVYIIDEVHMLTKEAFNALLKTLEEPPVHAVFILATTELHKLPDTIISRCQQFVFRQPTETVLREHIMRIATDEGYTLPATAAELIATLGDGSFRDALGVLEKVIAYSPDKKLDADEVGRILGAPAEILVQNIITGLATDDPEPALQAVQLAAEQNIDMELLTRMVLQKLRQILLVRFDQKLRAETQKIATESGWQFIEKYMGQEGASLNAGIVTRLLDALTQFRYAPIATLPLELAILDSVSGK